MALSRLVYYSENRLNPSAGPLVEQVSQLLAQSVGFNRTANVTGGLVYDTCWFAQVLEGDDADVDETFTRIARDLRHDEVIVVERGPIEKRRFGFWWMAAAGCNGDKAAVLRAHGATDRFDPRRMSADAIANLIGALVHFDTQYTIPPLDSSAPATAMG